MYSFFAPSVWYSGTVPAVCSFWCTKACIVDSSIVLQVISQAVEAKDLSVTVQLASNRNVRLNEFKNNILVDVREYYEAGGETKPGSKGLSMTTAQWNDLASVLPDLQSALQN